MKKIMGKTARNFGKRTKETVILVALTFLVPGAFASTNLIRNGDFAEDKNSDERPDRWFFYDSVKESSVDPEAIQIKDSTVGKLDDFFARITRNGGETVFTLTQKLTEEVVSQIVNNPDSVLVLKGKIRSSIEEPTKALINIQMLGKTIDSEERKFAGRMATPQPVASGDWEKVETSFRISDVADPSVLIDHIEVNCVMISPKGRVDFDDVSLSFE